MNDLPSDFTIVLRQSSNRTEAYVCIPGKNPAWLATFSNTDDAAMFVTAWSESRGFKCDSVREMPEGTPMPSGDPAPPSQKV